MVCSPAAGAISSTPDRTYVTNGPVRAVVRAGDTIYIGGDFTQVGPRTSPGVAIDRANGQADAALPQVSGGDGSVFAVIADGAGGWYIGGAFTRVEGVARANLAHIEPDGTLDAAWNPSANAGVRALVVSGSTVYAGGNFLMIDGQTRLTSPPSTRARRLTAL